MTRITLACLVSLAAIAATASPSAQAKPDFSGTWTMDEKRSGSATHESFVGPVVWIVQQTPQAVVVDRKRGDTVVPYVYTLHDTAPAPRAESAVTSPSGDAPGHRAHWDGDRLVMETLQNIQGKTVTAREVLTLGNGGRELIVERVLEVEHGYTMKGAQNFSAVKDIFTKTR
jgi:hypothetical protein